MAEYKRNESDSDRLRKMIAPNAISIDLVSAFAGDREMTETERIHICEYKNNRNAAFFSDIFYIISHHYFAPEIAEKLWNKVILHKELISRRLGRNVRITVATLDYLSNITEEISAPTLIAEAHISEIANLSMRDGMTGLFNHSSCYELLELEFRNHRRYGIGVSILMIDIDDFKSVNDRHGHQEGDRILVELAKTLTEQTRDSDICCRYGGEEFVIIMPFSDDVNRACEIAERIRAKATEIFCWGQRITISVGVSKCDQVTMTPYTLIDRADRALYQAKKGGKNQVVLGVR